MTLNLLNKTFGRVTVVAPAVARVGKSKVWSCICKCGAVNIEISARDLVHGNRKGCGACQDTKHPLYWIWRGILSRCLNKDLPEYKNYGGRGIQVCKEWQEDFYNFVSDVGSRDSKLLSLDRIDVNGNYEPGNVRWADAVTQANNKQNITVGLSDEALIDIYSSKESIDTLSSKYNISSKTIYNIRCFQYSKKATLVCLKLLRPSFFSPQSPPPQ